MKRIICIVFLGFSLLLYCSNNPVQPTTNGILHGRIVGADSLGVNQSTILIPGTSFLAISDSNGYFTIFNIPEGNYSLEIHSFPIDSTFENITVMAGNTTELPVWVFYGSFSISSREIEVSRINIMSVGDTLVDYLYADFSESISEYVGVDSVYFQFVIERIQYNEYDEYGVPIEEPVTVLHNHNILYDTIPSKGRIKTPVLALTGLDTFVIQVNHIEVGRFALLDSSQINWNCVSLSIGPTEMISVAYPSFYGQCVYIDSLLYQIDENPYSPVDWDILLVNNSTGDTCYWKNPQPDWGVLLDASDDPVCDYELFPFDSLFVTDQIFAGNLPNGTYSVLVKYFDGPMDSVTATPQLNIAFNKSWDFAILQKYYEISPTVPMQKGQTWRSGTFSLPEKVFFPDTTNSVFKAIAYKE